MAEESKKRSPALLNLIRRVHDFVENTDLDKHRQSQDHFGNLLGSRKDVEYSEFLLGQLECEWIRVKRPHKDRPVILYCHGGGYATGSRFYARPLTSRLAAGTSMDVVCFDYRLAPEHPFPAAAEDVMAVWDYLMLRGYGASDVILAGDSAGGNLALTLVLRLRGMGRRLPGGIVLLSPWTDFTASGDSYAQKASRDPVLDGEYLSRMIGIYAGGRDLRDPLLSPLFADFSNFPPTCIQVGEEEILLDDSRSLYKAMTEAGVRARLEVYPGMWHVFQMSPFRAAGKALDRVAEFLFEEILA